MGDVHYLPGSYVTVPEVARRHGLELDNNGMWTAGAIVRRMYELDYGELPPKALRPKSHAGGSHCFAVYPSDWEPRILAVLRDVGAAAAAQPDLF